LFGSFENIIIAKSEMPLGVRQNGIAVFNFSNAEVRKMAQTVRGQRPALTIKGYALQSAGESVTEADCISRVISADVRGVTFETTYNGETWALRAPVNGVHFVENLTGAILIARLFNVSWEQIAEGCRTLQMPKQTMQVYEMTNGVTIIDDSYNATPKGFESALRYLRLFPNAQRVVITSGVIELGSKTDEVHQTLGAQMRENIEQIFLTEKGFADSLRKGLGDQAARLKVVHGEDDVLPMLDALPAGTVILLEGRMPIYVTKWVQTHKRSEAANA
jgi:UDP-N-acetylmuramoyl-tripeptide--D-alanyl-D-alanine ligase